MNIPVGDTLYLNRNTKNLVTGLLTDATQTPMLIVRSGPDTLSGLTVAVTKIAVGRYGFTLVVDPAKFTAGRTYTVFVNHTAFNNSIVGSLLGALEIEEPAFTFRAVKAETTPGVVIVQVDSYSSGKAPLTSTTTQTAVRAAIDERFSFATDAGVNAHVVNPITDYMKSGAKVTVAVNEDKAGYQAEATNLPDDYMRSGAIHVAGMDALSSGYTALAGQYNALAASQASVLEAATAAMNGLAAVQQAIAGGDSGAVETTLSGMEQSLKDIKQKLLAATPAAPAAKLFYAGADGPVEF